jgi:hypothetical protein
MIDLADIREGNLILTGTEKNSDGGEAFSLKPFAAGSLLEAAHYYPLPLSPLILGYCGFKHEFGDWYINLPSNGKDAVVSSIRFKHKDQLWYMASEIIPVQPRYLHQLQNLYHELSGKALAVDLHLFRQLDGIKVNDLIVT